MTPKARQTSKKPSSEPPVLSVVEAMATGELRVQLESLRDRLASELATLQGRDVAPVARQLTLVCKELAALPQRERSSLDDLAERRRARREARVSAPAAVDVDGG